MMDIMTSHTPAGHPVITAAKKTGVLLLNLGKQEIFLFKKHLLQQLVNLPMQ